MLTEVSVEMVAEIVKSVFVTMMGLEVITSEAPSVPYGDRLTSFVQLTGEWNGAVMFECTRRQACLFAGRILAMDPPDSVDDDVRDMLGELANMIGGNMKCTMASGVRLSMPTVMDGSDYDLHICRSQVRDRLEFECEDGHFWVTVLSSEGQTL
jgi:chemotaxis protein CheX